MVRYLLVFGILGLAFTSFSMAVFAQECDAASISSDLADFSVQVNKTTDVSSTLDDIAAWLEEQQMACDTAVQPVNTASPNTPIEPALSFSSQQDGNQPVLGPITIPDGIYRVRLVTDGFFIGDLETIEGTCETSSGFGFFNIMMDRASSGAEVLLTTEGCKALISISNVSKPWTLDFIPIDAENAVPVEAQYSSEINGSMPILGPIDFENGRYKITVKTDGFIIADIEALSGECEANGFLGLFNIMQGQASEGAQTLLNTNNCVGLITISNVSEPWTLTLETLQ